MAETIHGAAFIDDRRVWSCVVLRTPDESLSVAIGRLLTRQLRRSLIRGVVVAAVGHEYSRLRVIPGIPQNLASSDVQELIETNRDRFFVTPFDETATTTVRKLADGTWQAAVIDAGVARECFEGCRAAGFRLRAIVPAVAAAHEAVERHLSASNASGNDEPISVVGAALHRPEWGLEFVPGGATAAKAAASGTRIRLAIAALIVASAVAWLGPNARELIAERDARGRLELLTGSQRDIESKLETLTTISSAISAVSEEDRGALPLLKKLAELDSLLPEDVVLQQVRMDSVALEIVLVAPEATSVVATLASFDPSLVMVGMVTKEPMPSALQRVVLRFPQPQTPVRRKRSRNIPKRGDAK